MNKTKYGYKFENEYIKYFFSNRNVDAKNTEKIKEVLKEENFTIDNLKYTNQVHGTEIKIINENYFASRDNGEYDAIITNNANTPIMIFTADCVPIIFYDEVSRVVALAHAGWRGTYENIAGKVVKTMVGNFKCDAQNIKIVIAPHITVKNYEVSEELITKFSSLNLKNYFEKIDTSYFLNLFEINKQLLVRAGIKEENITNSNFCTVDNNDEFFSYRKDNGTSERIGTVIELKEI